MGPDAEQAGYLDSMKRMRAVAKFFTGPVMTLAGINHFVMPRAYESIVPDALPYQRGLVYASGVAEILGALGSMHPRTRRLAGLFLIATLVVVFPANIYMAMNVERYDVPGGQAALLARLPLQVLFIYWVWLATQTDPQDGRDSPQVGTSPAEQMGPGSVGMWRGNRSLEEDE